MKKLLLIMIALVALASCGKDELDPEQWKVDSPFGVTTVSLEGVTNVVIQKNGTQSFYKYLYEYIEVSCNNCAYRVNGKQYGISTRFYPDGREVRL